MTHLKIIMKHPDADLPFLFYSELDSNRWEVRKVEIFQDGTTTYAGEGRSSGSTGLGLVPIPPMSELMAQPELELSQITKKEFDEVWVKATQQ